ALEPDMIALVEQAKDEGETLGGAVTVIARGVPVGLGSYVQWSDKLDGGLAGGVTNGEDVVITAYKKPIATLRKGLPSVDLDNLSAAPSQYERSDVTALPAAGVIVEAMVALVLA